LHPDSDRRGASTVVTAGIIIGVILLAGGGYFVETTLSPHPATGSTTGGSTEETSGYPTQSNLTSSQSTFATVSTVSSSYPSESSTTAQANQTSSASRLLAIRMEVNTTILDGGQAYNECGNETGCNRMIYIFSMTVFNVGIQNYTFNELNLYLQTNTGKTYMPYPIVYAIETPADGHQHALQTTDIAPGGRIAGEEGFEVPAGETPAQLLYQDVYAGVNATANLPSVTSWVSEVSTFGSASIWPADIGCYAIGNDQQSVCYTAMYTGMNHSILASSDYFTGEVMAFNITLSLGKGDVGLSPGTVAVRSNIAGFFVKGVSAPECIGGTSSSCQNWTVVVLLVPQPGVSYYGDPALTVSLPPA
jgi:uncharacterized protein DUF4352